MTTPPISVVIPAYNAAATLARALDSVLAQTHPALEVVVVDDGSADNTGEVVAGYASHGGPTPVRYLRQANAGPSAARNRGVEAARGEWIAFLDADDWYYPERLARHAQMIQADPALDFLVGNFDYRGSDGTLMQASMTDSALGRELLAAHGPQGQATIEGAALARYMVEQFSDTRMLTLPRATFVELGGFPLDLRICEDVVFLLRLCARSRRAGVSCEPGAVYLVHDAGLIRSDRLRAQTESVRALRGEAARMHGAPPAIRQAWRQMVKDAYLDLAYYLVKQGRRGEALRSLGRSFAFHPAAADLRQLLSIVRG
ncbi:MAG: glycosyltransferase family 2 protein [Betaproteobacteria bacterium]|nr:glycosyltransferase family 2 protein [Betaproteobacteria bacterium]